MEIVPMNKALAHSPGRAATVKDALGGATDTVPLQYTQILSGTIDTSSKDDSSMACFRTVLALSPSVVSSFMSEIYLPVQDGKIFAYATKKMTARILSLVADCDLSAVSWNAAVYDAQTIYDLYSAIKDKNDKSSAYGLLLQTVTTAKNARDCFETSANSQGLLNALGIAEGASLLTRAEQHASFPRAPFVVLNPTPGKKTLDVLRLVLQKVSLTDESLEVAYYGTNKNDPQIMAVIAGLLVLEGCAPTGSTLSCTVALGVDTDKRQRQHLKYSPFPTGYNLGSPQLGLYTLEMLGRVDLFAALEKAGMDTTLFDAKNVSVKQIKYSATASITYPSDATEPGSVEITLGLRTATTEQTTQDVAKFRGSSNKMVLNIWFGSANGPSGGGSIASIDLEYWKRSSAVIGWAQFELGPEKRSEKHTSTLTGLGMYQWEGTGSAVNTVTRCRSSPSNTTTFDNGLVCSDTGSRGAIPLFVTVENIVVRPNSAPPKPPVSITIQFSFDIVYETVAVN